MEEFCSCSKSFTRSKGAVRVLEVAPASDPANASLKGEDFVGGGGACVVVEAIAGLPLLCVGGFVRLVVKDDG